MACLFVVYVLFFKDLEHANFYLFFLLVILLSLEKDMLSKFGPEMDLKRHAPILQFPKLTPKVEGFLDAHGFPRD